MNLIRYYKYIYNIHQTNHKNMSKIMSIADEEEMGFFQISDEDIENDIKTFLKSELTLREGEKMGNRCFSEKIITEMTKIALLFEKTNEDTVRSRTACMYNNC